MASGPASLLTRRAVQAVAHRVANEGTKKVFQAYVVPPAVFYVSQACQWRSSVAPQPVQPQAQPAPAPVKQKRTRFRRLKALCASVAHAVPFSGLGRVAVQAAHQLSSLSAVVSFSSVAAGGVAVAIAAKGVRRWHAARRSAKRAMIAVNAGPAAEVAVVTFNIRGIMDRWPERAPVLRGCLKQADADVFCFQEVLTGEFAQELRLLGDDYQVYECRAALQHLSASSLIGAAYAATVRGLLGISWARSLLVSLPESVETWREKNNYSGNWSRLLRDLAIAPFYGNSIATRLPVVQLHNNKNSSSSSSSSKPSSQGWSCSTLLEQCWPSSSSGSNLALTSSSRKAEDVLVLGDFRAAQRVCLQLQLSRSADPSACTAAPHQQDITTSSTDADRTASSAAAAAAAAGGGCNNSSSGSSEQVVHVWLVNTHLDHAAADIRNRQTAAICAWMEPLKCSCAGIVLTGDLNAPPDEALHQTMAAHGFLSTHRVANGDEPSYTWPSGIQAPLMDEGEPHCADYIYAWQAPGYQLHVTAAHLCGDEPTAEDHTLFPSDHIGIKVKLRVVANSSGSSKSGSSSSSSSTGDGGSSSSKHSGLQRRHKQQ